MDRQHRVVEAVFVDHGRHALNAEVSPHKDAEVQSVSGCTPPQTGGPPLLLVQALRRSLVVLGEVEALQLRLQLSGQGAESGPHPGGAGVARQRRLGAGFLQGAAALRRRMRSGSLEVGAAGSGPPPPGGAPLGGGRPGSPQGAASSLVFEEGAESAEQSGLRLQITETQTAESSSQVLL